jgi:hypothetical protein
MNLLCPNCQNPVTVDEQFAGQLMKCPLCNQNFTVPALPQAAGAAHDTAPHPESGEAHPEVYGVQPEAHPAPPSPQAFTGPAAAAPPASVTTGPAPAPAAPARDGYRRTASVVLSPRVLPWVAAGSLFLVFILLFFPWVGRFPGGHAVYTQSGWGAAFGSYSLDEVYENKAKLPLVHLPPGEGPGFSVMLFFFLLFFLAALALAVAAAALPHLHNVKLPPAAERLLPWRWALAAGVTLVALLFLLSQFLTGFRLEQQTHAQVAKAMEGYSANAKTPEERMVVEIVEGELLGAQALRRTFYLRLSLVLLVVTVLAAGGTHWLLQRGEGRPLPRMELMW